MTKIKKPIETQPEVDTYGFENDLIDVDTNVDIEIIQEPSTNAKSIIDAISSGVDSIADKDIGTSNKSKSASRTEFNKNDLISIKSITFGEVEYISTFNAKYNWPQYGATRKIPFEVVEEMMNTKSVYFDKPYLLIMNEDLIEFYNLGDLYADVAKVSDLKSVFNMGNLSKITKVIRDGLMVNQRDTIIAQCRKMWNNGELVNIKIIQMLEKELKYKFT